MARLPSEVIEQIKVEVSLLRLVESHGYQPKKQGKDYALCCPFHDDKTPSLIITPKNNLFNCFGCGASGSVIDWVMKTQRVSFRHACEILQAESGVVVNAETSGETPLHDALPSPVESNSDDSELLGQVIDYYHATLKQSEPALAYLDKRGLNHLELIDQFKLGFANRTLTYYLSDKDSATGAAIRGRLQRIGIYRSTGHEHFNGSLVVPLINEQGQVTEVYGRKIAVKKKQRTPNHLYLPGPHQGVWNAAGLAGQKAVILCEALLDAMTFWVHGFRNVTASFGTHGFTDDHLSLFKQSGIERVLIAYDSDESGNNAADTLAKKLNGEGLTCLRIVLPRGMDVNEYALQVAPPEKSLGLVIRQAKPIGEVLPVPEPEKNTVTETALPELEKNADTVPLAAEPTAVECSTEITVMAEKPSELKPLTETTATPPTDSMESISVNDNDIRITLGSRCYRVRGLEKNKSADVLKVNLLCSNDHGLHVDSFDLYSAKHRQHFTKLAAVELAVEDAVIKHDMGRVLLQLETVQHQAETETEHTTTVTLTESERDEALALLHDPDLLDRVLNDFDRCGVVGEHTNKLVGYLAAGSRKLDRPLAVMIQSTSAAGKSSLMEAVLNLMPEEERVQFSAMTGQSLFYMGETNLKHKILASAEEEGASNASYALKLLQSEGEITIASTGKDEATGDLVTKEYKVEGPVMLFLTTTAIDIDEELLNRCVVLAVNESREQTQAIHQAQRQRRTLAGLQAKQEKDRLVKLHRNAQRLIKPMAVINPYADQLTFLDDKTRTRRDHEKYLTLIDSIALLHQYQRPIKHLHNDDQTLDYIEVQLSDIETANRLAHDVLGRTLDELPPQTRKLLTQIQRMVNEVCEQEKLAQKDYRFSRKTIRAYTGWSDGQLKIHCSRLTEMEYLLVHQGGRGQLITYELLYDGQDNSNTHLMGLIDPATLNYEPQKLGVNNEKSGQNAQKAAPSQGQVSPKLGPSQGQENTENTTYTDSTEDCLQKTEKRTSGPEKNQPARTESARTHTAH